MTNCPDHPSRLAVIEQAIRNARGNGFNEYWQYRQAIEAALRYEPDMSAHSAGRLANSLLEQLDGAVPSVTGYPRVLRR